MESQLPATASTFPPTEVLTGRRVTLIPMSKSHVEQLWAVASDPSIWEWSPWPVRSEGEMATYVSKALAEYERAESVPFVTVDTSSDQIIGSTRYMNIDTGNRRLEIGCTWIAPNWQRTGANREAKLLMLSKAFEELRFDRVELKTDMMNVQSRTAIARLGAKQEGVLRRHVLTRSGRVRDTVYFSILSSEWPEVKERLVQQLKD